MRDGRLIRTVWPSSYKLVDGVLLTVRETNGVALTPLGNRKRYQDFGDEALAERDSLSAFDKFLATGRNSAT